MKLKSEVKRKLSDFFSDTLMEAEEYIIDGEITPEDTIDAFVDAIVDWAKYYRDRNKVYGLLTDAIYRKAK
jgi:hypothetical protein